ncbi:uncharacterized protein LTR77_010549 [Saxophila tyrrhenica]|uniref:Uncharacterized protein n=1 Tax=Saxophila tyrrhenica TaxID=1690608 RepID=A0AAV9NV34_9PEZI|nr:hypothetical protein LTR77_010549 [Saxophila tyrrhenica]
MSIYSRMFRYRELDENNKPIDRTKIVQNSPLLNLPRELRDEILCHILEARNEPPRYPPTVGRRTKLHDIHYPPYVPFRYPSWVWVCRQLRNECFEKVSGRTAGRPLKAELDIIFKGYLSWPTWTYLPPLLPREKPFDLDVTLRIFSTEAFRSNDGWPRQPDGDNLYRINQLSVQVSFHDDYSPDTFPETAHNIFRMLKELATVGLTDNIVKTVSAHTEYVQRGKTIVFKGEWDVPEESDDEKKKEWNQIGFFCPAQLYSRSRYPTSHST